MRERIHKLRKAGWTVKKIQTELKCCKSTVLYHLQETTRATTGRRGRRFKKNNPLKIKIYRFLQRKVIDFKRRTANKRIYQNNIGLNPTNIAEKLIAAPVCYLTGECLDLSDPKAFQLDHKIPVTRGGESSENNMGLTSWRANRAKGDMTVNEFLELCAKVLRHHGAVVQLEERCDGIAEVTGSKPVSSTNLVLPVSDPAIGGGNPLGYQ